MDIKTKCITATYKVELDKDCTVGEFIADLLSNHKTEFKSGNISIYRNDVEWRHFCYPRCSYRDGNLSGLFSNEILTQRIRSITAHSVMEQMNFTLRLYEKETSDEN